MQRLEKLNKVTQNSSKRIIANKTFCGEDFLLEKPFASLGYETLILCSPMLN